MEAPTRAKRVTGGPIVWTQEHAKDIASAGEAIRRSGRRNSCWDARCGVMLEVQVVDQTETVLLAGAAVLVDSNS